MALVPSLERHRVEFSARINDVIDEVNSVLGLENHPECKQVEICARAKANAYVALSAAQEHLVSEAFQSCIAEISGSGVLAADLKPCVFSVFLDPEFSSIASNKSLAAWNTRLEVLEALFRADQLQPTTIWPNDGKTLKPDHYVLIWKVLCLPGAWSVDPTHALAVKDLCNGRNDVAHGRMSRNAFGRTKVCTDVLKLARKIEEIGEHYLLSLDQFIVTNGYRR
jgi:hypothetical protein